MDYKKCFIYSLIFWSTFVLVVLVVNLFTKALY